MKLFYATNNASKIFNMKRRFLGTDLEIITPNDLDIHIEVDEEAGTLIGNAKLKALAYSEKLDMPVIAGDSGFFIDGVSEDDNPGIYVRRVKGRTLTDDEMIDHYSSLSARYGGELKARNLTGLVLIVDGEIFTAEIADDDVILSSTPNKNRIHRGNPLDVVMIEPRSGKYYNELTAEDVLENAHSFDEECIRFISSHIKVEHES